MKKFILLALVTGAVARAPSAHPDRNDDLSQLDQSGLPTTKPAECGDGRSHGVRQVASLEDGGHRRCAMTQPAAGPAALNTVQRGHRLALG